MVRLLIFIAAGAPLMKLTGLFKWSRDPDREEGPGAPRHLFDATPADLELEKRWLQLAQVDSDEFRLFFEKYHDHVYRYLAACVGDPEVAQDLTQETFLYALDHLGRFNLQRGSFGVWLFHIARNRVLTRHRRRGRQAAEAEFLGRHRPGAIDPDPVGRRDRAAMLARLRVAIQGLSPQRRDAYVLHVQLEYSIEVTAQLMGVKPQTVQSLLKRGRPQLAEALRQERALTPEERRMVDAIVAEERGLVAVPPPAATGQDVHGRDGRADAGGSRRDRAHDDQRNRQDEQKHDDD